MREKKKSNWIYRIYGIIICIAFWPMTSGLSGLILGIMIVKWIISASRNRKNQNIDKTDFMRSQKPDKFALPATIIGFILGGLIALLSGCGSTVSPDQTETAPAYISSETVADATETSAPIA